MQRADYASRFTTVVAEVVHVPASLQVLSQVYVTVKPYSCSTLLKVLPGPCVLSRANSRAWVL